MDRKTRQAFIDIVGPENFTEKIIDLVSYTYDASNYQHRPDCAMWATSSAQVSRILSLANGKGIPVTVRGGGTGLGGLAVPARGGIVLDLTRMNRILELSIPDRLAVVQPGVVYADFQAALVPHGFFFPPDPASGVACTLGGNVGTNAGGLHAVKYGTTRDYVLRLEAVLASGEIMRVGARTMKTSSGYDLCRFLVGSEGTLAVVTEITLKIAPKASHTATALASFHALENAGEAVTQVMHSEVTPSVLELLDGSVLSLLREHAHMDLPDVEALLLVETDGMTEDYVRFQLEKVADMFRACNAAAVRIATTEEEAARLWKARKSIGGMVGALHLDCAPEDITVPMSQIAEFLRRSAELSRVHRLDLFNFGHAGDGNLHTNVLFDGNDPEQVERLEVLLYDLHKLACDLGGTLSGEHGIGMTKAKYMPLEHDPTALKVMRELKQTLDPNNILNPGKMGLDQEI
jgi:glycolate oxidase